jgi:hypothetical protein
MVPMAPSGRRAEDELVTAVFDEALPAGPDLGTVIEPSVLDGATEPVELVEPAPPGELELGTTDDAGAAACPPIDALQALIIPALTTATRIRNDDLIG